MGMQPLSPHCQVSCPPTHHNRSHLDTHATTVFPSVIARSFRWHDQCMTVQYHQPPLGFLLRGSTGATVMSPHPEVVVRASARVLSYRMWRLKSGPQEILGCTYGTTKFWKPWHLSRQIASLANMVRRLRPVVYAQDYIATFRFRDTASTWWRMSLLAKEPKRKSASVYVPNPSVRSQRGCQQP